jgi:hypothetical protein
MRALSWLVPVAGKQACSLGIDMKPTCKEHPISSRVESRPVVLAVGLSCEHGENTTKNRSAVWELECSRSHNPPELARLGDCGLKGMSAKLAYLG